MAPFERGDLVWVKWVVTTGFAIVVENSDPATVLSIGKHEMFHRVPVNRVWRAVWSFHGPVRQLCDGPIQER